MSLFLSLREGASIVPGSSGEILLQSPNRKLLCRSLAPGLRGALRQLAAGGAWEDDLADTVLQTDGPAELSRLYYFLDRFTRSGTVLRSAQLDGKRLATLIPISRSFAFSARPLSPAGRYCLSRFAYMHRLDGEMILESPRSHARLRLLDWRVTALVHCLAQPHSPADLRGQIPGLTDSGLSQLLTLLIGAELAEQLQSTGGTAEDDHPALQVWEFHDLLFHARSRTGRHDSPAGGTYRFLGRLDPPPALKSATKSEVLELYRPDLAQLQRDDPPFAYVQESRRSIRTYGDAPITARQLGEFLYRTARVQNGFDGQEVKTPRGTVRLDFATRPYPGGGALYELELYVVVNACTGLAPGLYHYDPLGHRLETISGRTADVEMLLWNAREAENLQVVLIISARFQRLAWKYASVAYAMTLKHVGVLLQTMYLAATAMGLAPCAVGFGDSDLFSRAAGTDYYTETSVGEFLLGSRKIEEAMGA